MSRSVSASTGTCSAAPGSRSARSRICAADSSPETYSVRRPAPSRLPSAIDVSVDLPIPGEPPISTSEPGTRPPPRIRSSSPIPVFSRANFGASTSCSRCGLTAATRFAGDAARPPPPPRVSSLSVFHSPQPGHWPIQRGVSAAQAEQTKAVDARAMVR